MSRMSTLHLRDALGRTGRGVRANWRHGRRDREVPREDRIYWCHEPISVRDTFDAHAPQDGARSQTTSLRQWVGTHCDPLSDETVRWTHRGRSLTDWGWRPVVDERSAFVAGVHERSHVTHTDLPWTHETRDWNGNLVPSPACTYMLTDDRSKLAAVLVKVVRRLDDDTAADVLWDLADGDGAALFDILCSSPSELRDATAALALRARARHADGDAIDQVFGLLKELYDTVASDGDPDVDLSRDQLETVLSVVRFDWRDLHGLRRAFGVDLDDLDRALRRQGTTLDDEIDAVLAAKDLGRIEIHNEWESGSMPLEWRPFWGEYVTLHGRFIYDIGHSPVKTEIHPGHTVVREHTTAAPLGPGGEYTPANRAIVGMGFSGGFPGHTTDPMRAGGVDDRWDREFGGRPRAVWGDTKYCWPTDLRDHPLTFKLFPPVAPPSGDATLSVQVDFAEVITTSSWSGVNDFLELCQNDDPAEGGRDLAFRVWNRSAGLPDGFTPRTAPASDRPSVTTHDGCATVEVDLSPLGDEIPLGYYASVTCGWDERDADTDIYQFDVTFDQLEVQRIDDPMWDDWHLYYGVNGEWGAWWTDDYIRPNTTYDVGHRMRAYTVDDLPLFLRDCGVEWDGGDTGNTTLDSVRVDLTGPDHLDELAAADGVRRLSGDSSQGRFRVAATETDGNHQSAEHQWVLDVERRVL